MKSKSLFSLSLLLLATLAVSLGTGTEAQAQTYTINAVRIYVNPDMVDPSEDGMPVEFANARTSPIGGKLPKVANSSVGTLSTEGGGVEITADNALDYTANAGDIIAIAFQVTATGGSVLHGSVISLAGWETGGPRGMVGVYTKPLYPSRLIEGSGGSAVPVSPTYNFTVVYAYPVRSGDMDTDGNWLFHRSGNRPFHRWTGALNATYSTPITVYYPRIDGSVSTIPTVTRLTISRPPAGQSGHSRYYKVRQECLDHQRKYGDVYTNACELVQDHGWALPNDPTHPVTLANSLPTAFFKAGDTIEFQLQFSEEVIVTGAPVLELMLDGGTGRMHYVPAGSGATTLTFRYTVQQGDTAFGGIAAWNAWGNIKDGNSIEDISGHKVNSVTRDVESAIRAFFAGQEGIRAEEAHPWLDPPGAYWKEYATGIAEYLVDTVPPTVWIPGLIKNGETHTDDRRNAFVSVEPTYLAVPTFTEADLRASITESESQTDAFDVEFRFFNWDGGALADEVGISFTGDDVEITGANVERADWAVETTYIGLDHRATNQWPPTDRAGQPAGSAHKPGHAKNSASFLVYKATIRPALGFQGNVSISLPAGATQDIAGNDSYASNTLTVPVNNPLRVVEKPEIVVPPAGVHTAGDKIEVEVTYDKENLRYEGDNPPYLTLYLGEEVPANARHAVWSAQEDANSTKVTFAYTVAANDVAQSLRVAEEIGLTVPSDTRLVDDTGSQLSGTGEPAKGSGEGLETTPPPGQGQLQGDSDQELAPRTEVPINLIYLPEESEPKAAATDVPRSPIVFNELGNGSGDADDWLELRNVTGDAVSLKDWELSIVQDGNKEDTSLIAFAEEVSVPANGLLLIVNTSPDKTSLAGGDNVATAEVETKGSSHLYLVKSELSLPDDGKFLLILRNAKDKRGLNEAFVDVAGGGGSDTDAFIREQTGDYDTHVWPLQVLQAPGDDTEDALGSGKVWQRAKADIVGYHRDAWAESAFTGLGYDRKVTESAATSGTPGYPNGAVKPGSATPKGSITFSEIMVDSGGRTLPQWIELYNNSKTDAINLNRWELEIQNVDSEDLVGRPIVTLTLSEKVIQPNQTLLIVAGPARASSDSYLPADRVYDLLALHEKNLRIKSARDTFLSTEGFYLQLSDRNGNLVDEIGNRDSDRRSDDAPAWALPLSFEEGSRSSIIRRYDKGVALPGRKRASWVLASRIKPFDESLHYGHADDIGTPGHREGGALPVELSNFSMARTEAGAVVLTWTTESEVDNAGFNLRRSEKRASGFTLLNPALIAGAGTTGERQTYTFTDTSAKPGIEYYYQIEEVAFDGKRETLVTRVLPGPVSASNRMLTTFGALKKRE